ncbi:MAG: acyl-CoA thioesterase [Candidatus Eisenbacteria bacterium]
MAEFLDHTRVRFHEADPAGIVFFARVFRYAHDAYEAWLRSIGLPLDLPIEDRGYALPLAHAEADFRAPMRVGDELALSLVPVAIGRTSYTIAVRIALAGSEAPEEERLRATVRTVHVCIDPSTGRPRELPIPLRKALEEALPPAT